MSFIDTRSISSLYRPVVEMLLVDECEFFSALRCQFSSARVLSIREDGYGIFVDFEVDPLTRIISPEIEYARVDGLVGIDKSNRLVCGFALLSKMEQSYNWMGILLSVTHGRRRQSN